MFFSKALFWSAQILGCSVPFSNGKVSSNFCLAQRVGLIIAEGLNGKGVREKYRDILI